MREVIKEIFSGTHALFTGKFLASFVMLPVFFMSFGVEFPLVLNNVVNEDALYSSEETQSIDDIIEPDAGQASIATNTNQTTQRAKTPTGIVESTPVAYDLTISGKVATSVVNVGLDSNGVVVVPGSTAGFYSDHGSHLLVGHNPGIFSGLTTVSVGDMVYFRGVSYQVYNKQIFDYDPNIGTTDSNGQLTSNGALMSSSLYNGGSTGLNMMTCYGTYQRLVVFASQI